MRVIRSFEDVQQVLRDQETAINEFRSRMWDLNQRRITNVHPSQDEYDVVVRKELKGLGTTGSAKEITPVAKEDYDVCVFGVGINTNAVVGIDVCPRYISAFNGTFVKCFAMASDPPTGRDLIFDIRRYHLTEDTSIFTAPMHLTDGLFTVQTTTSFAVASIAEGDTLGFTVTQLGNNNPGSMIVVKLKIRRT